MTAVLHSPSPLALRAPAILDVEASGFGRGSYPIEVGFVEPSGTVFCSLIQPEPDWQHWDPSAELVHGISREILQRHGKPPAWVAAQINDRLSGQTVYCDAWAHDYSWLARLFDSADMMPAFHLQDLRCLLSEAEAACWHQLREQVREELKLDRHRASADARVLQTALLRLREPARR
ncbi:MAG: hypothetical protein CFE41_09025 [Burkholderiales bacterium PBB2]|nr:MAG: hypothetical protein CFE41_09025 [Burkholderiales bacterium PBB2]